MGNRARRRNDDIFGIPPIGGFRQLDKAEIEKMQLIRQAEIAREKSAKIGFIACKSCGNRVMVKQDLVEMRAKEYPAFLSATSKSMKPEITLEEKLLTTVYVCAKCLKEVVRQNHNKLTEHKGGEAFGHREEESGGETDNQHIESGQKEQKSDADSRSLRNSGGQDSEMQGGVPGDS